MTKDFEKFLKMCASWRAEKPEPGAKEILIYGVIMDMLPWWDDGAGAVVTSDVLARLEEMKDEEEIVVRINSPGGIAAEGVAIYNALYRHPANIKVHVDALAASAASIIAMAGNTIQMAGNATMMIHEPWGIAMGDSEDFLKAAEALDVLAQGLMKTYSARTGQTDEEVRKMMKAETWFTAEDAVEKGFADEVTELQGKAKASLDLSIYAHAPEWLKEKLGKEAAENEKKKARAEAESDEIAAYLRMKRLEIEEATL